MTASVGAGKWLKIGTRETHSAGTCSWLASGGEDEGVEFTLIAHMEGVVQQWTLLAFCRSVHHSGEYPVGRVRILIEQDTRVSPRFKLPGNACGAGRVRRALGQPAHEPGNVSGGQR